MFVCLYSVLDANRRLDLVEFVAGRSKTWPVIIGRFTEMGLLYGHRQAIEGRIGMNRECLDVKSGTASTNRRMRAIFR